MASQELTYDEESVSLENQPPRPTEEEIQLAHEREPGDPSNTPEQDAAAWKRRNFRNWSTAWGAKVDTAKRTGTFDKLKLKNQKDLGKASFTGLDKDWQERMASDPGARAFMDSATGQRWLKKYKHPELAYAHYQDIQAQIKSKSAAWRPDGQGGLINVTGSGAGQVVHRMNEFGEEVGTGGAGAQQQVQQPSGEGTQQVSAAGYDNGTGVVAPPQSQVGDTAGAANAGSAGGFAGGHFGMPDQMAAAGAVAPAPFPGLNITPNGGPTAQPPAEDPKQMSTLLSSMAFQNLRSRFGFTPWDQGDISFMGNSKKGAGGKTSVGGFAWGQVPDAWRNAFFKPAGGGGGGGGGFAGFGSGAGSGGGASSEVPLWRQGVVGLPQPKPPTPNAGGNKPRPPYQV